MSILVFAGILLIFLGFVFIILGSIGSMFGGDREASQAEVSGGGIIMLGPIPIVFGSDKGSVKTLILIAIVLMAAYFLLSFVLPSFL